MGRLTELTHFEKCISTLQQVAISTVKNVTTRTVENAIMGKVVTPALSSLMSGLKPTIKKYVDKSIRENIDQEKLKSSSYEDMQNIIKEIRESIDYETVMDIFKEAVLGITKYCSNWQVQLGALAVDQYISWKEVYNYAKDLCKKINDKLKFTGKSINQNIDELINQLIEQLSEEMYAQVVSTTTKTCQDVYLVGKSAYINYKQEKQEEAKCLEVNKDFKEGGLAGQEQAKALSDVIKRPVHIYEESGNIIIIGKQYLGDPIQVSYFPADEHNPTGHYVPYGKNENWSSSNGKNNCLFDAVGSQIGKDSSKLRTQTIQRIESDPTRYIAPDIREIVGTEILLDGGRTNQPILENHYPSHKNRIKVAGHEDVLAALRNCLNQEKEKCEQFNNMKEGKKICYIQHSKSIPQFGDPKKEEMMMGSLSVNFTDDSQLKLITVSGDSPFSLRRSVSVLSDNTEPITFNWEHKNFKFIDPGKPQGKIFDVFNRVETQHGYTKSCAAQKLSYYLGKHMKENPKLKIKGDIHMAEAWYKPGNAEFKAEQVIINKSCTYCEHVLPIATGENFTGNGFSNYQEFSYWNQYSRNGIETLLKLNNPQL